MYRVQNTDFSRGTSAFDPDTIRQITVETARSNQLPQATGSSASEMPVKAASSQVAATPGAAASPAASFARGSAVDRAIKGQKLFNHQPPDVDYKRAKVLRLLASTNMTCKQISEKTGVPAPTVENWMRQAREDGRLKLSRKLSEDADRVHVLDFLEGRFEILCANMDPVENDQQCQKPGSKVCGGCYLVQVKCLQPLSC